MKKIDKIFGDKKANSIIYILLAVGILMLTVSSGGKSDNREKTVSSSPLSRSSQETKLEEILSEIDGVGTVSVMLCHSQTLSDSAQTVFASQADVKNDKVSGVLIVADGGANPIICEKIIRATKAALGVETHKIEVLERTVYEK